MPLRASATGSKSPKRKSPARLSKSPKRKSPARFSKSPKRKSARRSKSPKRKSPARLSKSPKRKSPARRSKSPKRKSPARRSKSPKRKNMFTQVGVITDRSDKSRSWPLELFHLEYMEHLYEYYATVGGSSVNVIRKHGSNNIIQNGEIVRVVLGEKHPDYHTRFLVQISKNPKSKTSKSPKKSKEASFVVGIVTDSKDRSRSFPLDMTHTVGTGAYDYQVYDETREETNTVIRRRSGGQIMNGENVKLSVDEKHPDYNTRFRVHAVL
jgi:hypothetical protein